MRILRFFLLSVALVLVLAALLATAAFLPSVQTMVAQRVLSQHPELRASLGSVSAGSGELTVKDLALVVDGAILALPSAQAQLPITAALWQRNVHLRRLTAKGWTLDLSGVLSAATKSASKAPVTIAAPSPASTPVTPAPVAVLIARHFLTAVRLPNDAAIDELDLEGDVLVPFEAGRNPTAVHTIIRGGGLAAGRDGTFTIEIAVPSTASTYTFAPLRATGRVTLALNSARSLGRFAIETDLSSKPAEWLDQLHVNATWSTDSSARGETGALELLRGNRRLANVAARWSPPARQLDGTWEIALDEGDLARFAKPTTLPGLALAGRGKFDSDPSFARTHATGQLTAKVADLGKIAPAWARIGEVSLAADFDTTHRESSLQFDRLELSVDTDRSVATARALQGFVVDETTAEIRAIDPQADWLAVSLHSVPLTWLFGSGNGMPSNATGITGDLRVQATGVEFTARAETPLLAGNVTLQRDGAPLASELAWSLPLTVQIASGGWRVTSSPLTVTHAGRQLASFDLKATRAANASPIKIGATWQADLEALRTETPLGARDFFRGRAATGNLTILAGTATNLDSKFVVTGRNPARTLNASLHVNTTPNGRFTFFAPLKLALGRDATDLTVEGSGVNSAPTVGRTVINLTGDKVVLDHLAQIAAPLAAAGFITLPSNLTATIGTPTIVKGARDASPFWGGGGARVGFDFGRLQAGGQALAEIGGTLFFDGDKISLEGGRGVFHTDRRFRAQGVLTFDPKADTPYRLKGSASVDEIDATLLLGPPPAGQEPLLYGRFAAALTLASEGLNLRNLAWNAEEELRLTSIQGGSTRLLETNVASAFTEAPTPMLDAVGTVGAVFGKLLGTKTNVLQAEKNPVSKSADAVLNFTYATKEFRYDQFAITATRGWDGVIRLTQLDLTAANERLTGTGQIDFARDRPVATRPLTLNLRLGFRGPPATFLTEAGVLSAEKNAKDYAWLEQPLQFAGTLEQIDRRAWRDLLVKAALPPAPASSAPKKTND